MIDKNVEELIKRLEKEIKQNANEVESGKQLLRLRNIAKSYEGDDKVVSSHELFEKSKNEPPQKKLLSGFQELDSILNGFREKQLIVLSGITKHGKTSFAIELTIRLKDENPLWIPFEEPAIELIQKFTERGQEPPLFYTPERILENTLQWIENKIIESIAKYNSKIVFIDHLGFIQDFERLILAHEPIAYQIERIMRSLKKMAVRWNVVIVVLAHLTKTRLDTNPTLEDLKGSSAIGQEADTVMILWRKTQKIKGEVIIGNEANLSVQANRRTGKTGNVKLTFVNGRFIEGESLPISVEDETW